MIITQRNRGASEARNTWIKYSNGEFIYFLDSEDFLDKNTLFELYKYAIKYNLDNIYFKLSSFTNNDIIKNDVKIDNLSDLNFVIKSNDIMEGKYLLVKIKTKKIFSPVIWLSFIKNQFYIENKLSFYPGIIKEDVL